QGLKDMDAQPRPSEAQRFYLQGERLRQEGNVKEAQNVWRNLILAFGNEADEKSWVEKAEQGLKDMDAKEGAGQRWTGAKAALVRAAKLAGENKRDEAEKIWTALEELYRADPFARDLLAEIARARKQ